MRRSRRTFAPSATTTTPAPYCFHPDAPSGCALCPWKGTCALPGKNCRSKCSTSRRKRSATAGATLIAWARQMGEGASYTDNVPMQCLHPVGHWYEVPNMMRNGTFLRLLEEKPRLKYLMIHNIDTTGADVDPGLLGYHIAEGAALTAEVIARQVEDRGGGLARVDGRLRL